jgi:hypothetical protein
MAKKDSSKLQLELMKDAQSAARAMGASDENIAELQETILSLRIKSHAELLKQLKTLQEITTQEKAYSKSVAEIEKIETNISDVMSQMSKDKFKIAQMSKDEFGIAKDLLKEKEKELAAVENLADYDKDRVDSVRKQINLTKELIADAEKLNAKFGETNLALINEGFDQLQSQIDSITSFLPKGISKFLGVDKLGENLKDAALDGKGLSKALMMTGAVAILASAYTYLADMNKQATEFAASTGLSVAQSQKLVQESLAAQASSKNQLATQEDILNVQKEMIAQLGPMATLSANTAVQVASTGKAFGYGAEVAGQVQSSMMMISGMSESAAANAQDFTAQLALAEGVAPGAVMKDIAKSAGVANKYFFGNAKALGEAAVEAQKMGMSLDDMAKTSDALLNIEESLTNQYQLSAMLGRQVNLDKARQLAAEGKIAEAAKETLKQLGGIQEFEKASIFEKERMAAAAGMTVEQLGKSLAIQEKMTNATEEELAAMNGLNLSASQIKNMSAEDLKSKLASQQSTEKLSQSMEKIASAMSTIILPVAQLLAPIFSGISTVVGYIVEGFQTLAPLLPYILAVMTALKAETILTAIATGVMAAFQTFKDIPILGVGLGIAAAIGAVGFIKSKVVDDATMQPVGPSGYSRVMSGPEGSIAFNDDDTIVAGTNLGGGGGGTAVIDQSSINAIVSAIQSLRIIIDESAVNAIAQKGAVRASFK